MRCPICEKEYQFRIKKASKPVLIADKIEYAILIVWGMCSECLKK